MDQIPEWYARVYRVSQFPKTEQEYWDRVRDYIVERDGLRCQACRKKGGRKSLTAHHIIPRVEGGGEELSNLVTLHHDCHDFVEVQGYRTLAEIIGCTKGIDKRELRLVASDEYVPEREKPEDEYPEPDDRVDIICPCGVYHPRKQSQIGKRVKEIKCGLCGMIGIYQEGEWKWGRTSLNELKRKPKPAPNTRHKSNPVKRKEKPSNYYEIENVNYLTCPVCFRLIKIYRDTNRWSYYCECGSQLIQNRKSREWTFYANFQLYKESHPRGVK